MINNEIYYQNYVIQYTNVKNTERELSSSICRQIYHEECITVESNCTNCRKTI